MMRMTMGWTAGAVAVVTLVGVVTPAGAQVRASERGTVSQVVDGTTISLDYGRPSVRDRSPVFPGVVDWGYVWTPGANASTRLEVDRPIRLAGEPLDSGAYSVWLRPAEDEPWLLMIDADPGRFHTQRPDTTDLVLAIQVEPSESGYIDALQWDFPSVRHDGTTLRMQWDRTSVEIPIEVTPTQPTVVAAEVAQAIVGEWELTSERSGNVTTLSIEYGGDGRLHGAWLYDADRPAWEFIFLPRGDHLFNPGTLWDDGRLRESISTSLYEFVVENGRAVRFEIRNADDDLTQVGVPVGDRSSGIFPGGSP